MKQLLSTLSVLLLLGIITSCYSDNKEDLYSNYQNNCDTTSTTFMATIKPIFTENCALSGCHNTVNRQSGLDLNSYTDIESIAKDNRLHDRIMGNQVAIMPPSGMLSQCDIDKILKWVRNGAQNN